MNHPNATASGLTSAVALITLSILGHLGVHVDETTAAAVVGIASAVVLTVGRSGLTGLARLVWKGSN